MSESIELVNKRLYKGVATASNRESKISFWQIKNYFISYAKTEKKIFYQLTALMLIQAGILGGGIWFLKYALDAYFQNKVLYMLILALILVTVVKSFLDFIVNWGQNLMSNRIRDRLISDAYKDLLYCDLQTHIEVRNSRKYGWILEDTEKFITSMFRLFQIWVRQPIQILSVIIAVAMINWKLTVYGCLILPLVIPCFIYIKKRSSKFIRQRKALLGLLEEKVAESIYGIRIVKTFSLESSEIKKLDSILTRQRRLFQSNAFHLGLMGPISEAIGLLGLILILLVGMQSVDSNVFTPGTFLAFMMAFLNIYRPFKELSMGVLQYQLAMDTGRRLMVLRDNAKKTVSINGDIVIEDIETIEFSDLWFKYKNSNDNNSNWVLKGINFTLKASQTVLLSGLSGAGKSTLCDLLFGLYQGQKGKIKINGIDINLLDKKCHRRLFAMCSQETIVFNESLINNIKVVSPDSSDDEVLSVAKMVCIPQRLLDHPEMTIGDRGLTLSGGERQRIALARAVLCKPKLLLIDEAMNNIDPDTEAKIWSNIRNYLPKTAFLVVSHRWLDLSLYDRLLVMGQGKLVDDIKIDDDVSTRSLFEKYRNALGIGESQ